MMLHRIETPHARSTRLGLRWWKQTPWDGVLVAFSIAQFAVTVALALAWSHASIMERSMSLVLLVIMTVYNIIVVSHVFTHKAWFSSTHLNRLVAVINSMNIGQSVKVYELFHVRNHHRYHNDRQGHDGTTMDLSSTFCEGKDGGHVGLLRYAWLGAARTVLNYGRVLLSAPLLWRVSDSETAILALAAKSPTRRAVELQQVQLERAALFAMFAMLVAVDWQWVLFCYLPAMYISFALVNVQNYYEHYRGTPGNRYANSVSHYGRLYNLLTLNDGYHQEHHIDPQCHWRQLPELSRQLNRKLDGAGRVVSPVPALLGFLHRDESGASARSAAWSADLGSGT